MANIEGDFEFRRFDFGFVFISLNLIKHIMMTTIELKAKLVKQINNLNNNSLLEHISEVIDFETHPDDIHLMSQGETDAVNEGIAQIKNGLWFTNEASDKHVDEWLKKHDGL